MRKTSLFALRDQVYIAFRTYNIYFAVFLA